MSENHTTLELEFDRELLEDVFDSPDLRYVLLYMFIIRKELFQDLIDDDLMESYELLADLEEPDCGDLRRICGSDLIKWQQTHRSGPSAFRLFWVRLHVIVS